MQPLLELPDQTSPDEIAEELIDIFVEEVGDILKEIVTSLNCWKASPEDTNSPKTLQRNFHTLKGSGSFVGAEAIVKLGGQFENLLNQVIDAAIPANDAILSLLDQLTNLLPSMVEQFKARQPTPDEVTSLISQARQLTDQLMERKRQRMDDPNEEPDAVIDDIPIVEKPLPKPPKPTEPEGTDDSSIDDSSIIKAIFLDEAERILENMQSLMESWQTTPHDLQLMTKLQGNLHTLKGASRTVGISVMGDLCHGLESVLTLIVKGGEPSNPKLQEIVQKVVQNSVDELAAMLEKVRSGKSLDTDENKELDNKDAGKVREDGIRVGVAVIDKLTDLVGELAISRAHLEQQQEVVKNNLSEMELTVVRLRDQLRRSEMETEAQILSHFKGMTELKLDQAEFDPLKLDRFSVRQQLSRSLLESISDLLNIQEAMKILTRQTDSLLIQQTRMGAELQYAITRTRMRPFSSISTGLQSTVRKTAHDERKPVDFIIHGEEIEFERTVLNSLNDALGHLLRNAIGHGIEDTATRQHAGKPAKGKITIDISKEGTELILQLRDDGAGLNLPKIRKRAEELGIIQHDTGDYELMQFILLPGFSTASQVTQTKGRGMGMDVVNDNIKELGGNLQIHSTTGQGARFEIRLPLSLTITQALLVHVGEETLAVPMDNVEAVMRVPCTEVLSDEGEDRFYKYMGHDYRVRQLGELLGFGQLTTDKPRIPSLLVHAADRRVALLVDNIEGSNEIVVKSVGPQIGAIQWLAGATILGDGRVVLILDVPALMRIDELPYIPPKPPKPPKPKEIRTIMVVDDSITVRKVTTRLLKRQGLAVLTAKDGIDALAQLQEQLPDLILLDVEMPKMDGYELATQIRNTPDWKHLPIIMITSRTGAKHRDRAEKIGIDRYLGKPFYETELLENINALLKERVSQRVL
jgi:chemosensory pili system protein ChpA (sensor histidine kinase/response regulator)